MPGPCGSLRVSPGTAAARNSVSAVNVTPMRLAAQHGAYQELLAGPEVLWARTGPGDDGKSPSSSTGVTWQTAATRAGRGRSSGGAGSSSEPIIPIGAGTPRASSPACAGSTTSRHPWARVQDLVL